jgi:hypothetical protein
VEVRKVLSIGVLTYLVFGVVSLFQLGIFLPPLPLKSILILIFVLLSLSIDKNSPKSLRFLLGGFTLFYVGAHASFWEVFISHQSYAQIQEGIETYFLLIAAILLPIFNYLFLLSLVNEARLRLILHVVLLLFVPTFIVAPTIATIDLALIGMAILYFFVGYSSLVRQPENTFDDLLSVFIAIGLINMIDRLVYLIY